MSAAYIPADLSKVTDIETLWSEVISLHPDGIDILVNCAGQLASRSCYDSLLVMGR